MQRTFGFAPAPRRGFAPAARVVLSILVAGLLACAGCGDDDNPSNPGNGGQIVGAGTMTATLDGAAWTAAATTAVNQSGLIAVGGSPTGLEAIGFAFFATAPGTFTIGPGQTTSANISNSAGGLWTANSAGGSGSITVTSLSATAVAGTFSFTAPTINGSTPATRVVTNGTFDLEFDNMTP